MGDSDVDFGDNNVRGNMSGGFDLRDNWLGRQKEAGENPEAN